MTSMLDEYNAMPEEKHMEICRKADELQRENLGKTEEFLREVLAAKPVGGKSIYFYDGEAYEVDQNFNPPIVKEVKEDGSVEK